MSLIIAGLIVRSAALLQTPPPIAVRHPAILFAISPVTVAITSVRATASVSQTAILNIAERLQGVSSALSPAATELRSASAISAQFNAMKVITKNTEIA